MILITVSGWLPQILDLFLPQLIVLKPAVAYGICSFGLLYYMISVGLYLSKIAPFLRKKYGKAVTLRIWEIFVSIGKLPDYLLEILRSANLGILSFFQDGKFKQLVSVYSPLRVLSSPTLKNLIPFQKKLQP